MIFYTFLGGHFHCLPFSLLLGLFFPNERFSTWLVSPPGVVNSLILSVLPPSIAGNDVTSLLPGKRDYCERLRDWYRGSNGLPHKCGEELLAKKLVPRQWRRWRGTAEGCRGSQIDTEAARTDKGTYCLLFGFMVFTTQIWVDINIFQPEKDHETSDAPEPGTRSTVSVNHRDPVALWSTQ